VKIRQLANYTCNEIRRSQTYVATVPQIFTRQMERQTDRRTDDIQGGPKKLDLFER